MEENPFEQMRGHVALITGATSGIGREASLLFARYGIKVALAARQEELGHALQKEITDFGGEATFTKTYVENHQSVKDLVDATMQKYGQIDYAFNNAGIAGPLGLLTEMEEHDYNEIFNINLRGIWHCLKFQLLAMVSRKSGSIVNVSTNLTKLGMAGTSLYSASKAGVESFTKVAAIEFGKFGIRVNVISPGAVDTPMLRKMYSEGELKNLSDENPLKKIAHPKDIAQTVLWLCSPMANHINGDLIFIDGGSLLQIRNAFEKLK